MFDDFVAEFAGEGGQPAAVTVLLDALPRSRAAELVGRLEEHHAAPCDAIKLSENFALAAVIRLNGMRGIDEVEGRIDDRDVKEIAGEKLGALQAEALREFARIRDA